MEITCPRCGYKWNTKSRSRYLKCPRCYTSFRNPYWRSSTTSTTTTTTSTTTNHIRSSRNIRDLVNRIEAYEMEIPSRVYEELRAAAEEVSTPDPSGVEVLVLDPGEFERIVGRKRVTTHAYLPRN